MEESIHFAQKIDDIAKGSESLKHFNSGGVPTPRIRAFF
jgi:hypothetical protein